MSERSVLINARALGVFLKISSFIPFTTGLLEVFAGTRVLTAGGASIPPATAVDPVLNSQLAFAGALWFGYGFALWWTSGDVVARAPILRILLLMLLLAALGRALAWLRFGWLGAVMTGGMLFELGSAVLLLAWLAAVVRARTGTFSPGERGASAAALRDVR